MAIIGDNLYNILIDKRVSSLIVIKMKDLNFDEWLSGYKKKHETAKYMSKVDLKKAFKEELKTLEQQKLAAKEKEKAEAFRRKEIAEKKAKEMASDQNLNSSIKKIQVAIECSTNYLLINSIGELEVLFNTLLSIPVDELKPIQKEFVVLFPKIHGRDEYLNAKNNLTLISLQKEQNKLLRLALSASASNPVSSNQFKGATQLVAASALLTNQKLSAMAEDVEEISEGFGFDD